MDLIKTKKFRITQSHFDRAVKKFKDPKHQEWIKKYFPFKPADIELPPKDTIISNLIGSAKALRESIDFSLATPVLINPQSISFFKPFFECLLNIKWTNLKLSSVSKYIFDLGDNK